MAEKNVGMSDGTSHGGINIGKNTGSVNTTQGAQQQGDRTIHNAGNIGNLGTGDHHAGQMTSSFGSAPGQKALADVTVDDVVCMLLKNKLGNYESIFRDKGVDGSLFLELTDELLDEFGVDVVWDRKRILNLKKFLPK